MQANRLPWQPERSSAAGFRPGFLQMPLSFVRSTMWTQTKALCFSTYRRNQTGNIQSNANQLGQGNSRNHRLDENGLLTLNMATTSSLAQVNYPEASLICTQYLQSAMTGGKCFTGGYVPANNSFKPSPLRGLGHTGSHRAGRLNSGVRCCAGNTAVLPLKP